MLYTETCVRKLLIPLTFVMTVGFPEHGLSQGPAHLAIPGGVPGRGHELIIKYGCGTCHIVEGVAGAQGEVGPMLTNFADRTLIAGRFPNVPRFLVSWILNPPALKPETAMPALGLTESEARDVASYLYTLGSAGPQQPSVAVTDRSGIEFEALRAEQLQQLEGASGDPAGGRVMGIERAIEALANDSGR